jgi:hypothetical protein
MLPTMLTVPGAGEAVTSRGEVRVVPVVVVRFVNLVIQEDEPTG